MKGTLLETGNRLGEETLSRFKAKGEIIIVMSELRRSLRKCDVCT